MDIKTLVWEIFLLVENSLDQGENFLDKGKIFVLQKLPRWRKNLCLWKTFLMKEASLLVENFLDPGKIFACGKLFICGKLSWWRKNFCSKKTSLIKEKILLMEYLFDKSKFVVENFIAEGKILAFGKICFNFFWKWNHITNQKRNLLVFLQ